MRLIVLAVGLLACAAPTAVMAQEKPPATSSAPVPSAQQLQLAERYLELSMSKTLLDGMEGMFTQLYGDVDLPAEERSWLAEQSATVLTQVMEVTFRDVRVDVARLFTPEELRAAIAFMETPAGRSFTNKSLEFSLILEREMTPHITEAMTKLMTKYCARFDCGDEGGLTKRQ